MFQKPTIPKRLQQLKQVALTYLTLRWVWFFLPLFLFFMLFAAMTSTTNQDEARLFFPGFFGIALPIVTCMQGAIAVVKWQFVDPRARLIPDYTRPHLFVVFATAAVFLVLNPLLLAYFQDISPLGPLAFALMTGGLFLWSLHNNRTAFMIPSTAVFFSALHPATSQFWFAGNNDYLAIHATLATLGAALTAGWLWKLTTLHEEDEGYFILPFGAHGSLSRLERVLQGRLEGRKAARGGPLSSFSDHWHNRLFTGSANPNSAALAQYGWSRFSPNQQAVAFSLGMVFYGVVLDYVAQAFGEGSTGPSDILVYAAAFALPGLLAAFSLRFRRVRMASELLRPATRTAYFDGLFKSLAKRAMVFWLAMNTGAFVVWITCPTPLSQGNPAPLAIGFLLLSAAVQFPVFALALRMAQWRSSILFLLGCYVLGNLELGLLVGWIILQKTYGPIPTALLAALALTALSLPLQTWSRNAWLRTELA